MLRNGNSPICCRVLPGVRIKTSQVCKNPLIQRDRCAILPIHPLLRNQHKPAVWQGI